MVPIDLVFKLIANIFHGSEPQDSYTPGTTRFIYYKSEVCDWMPYSPDVRIWSRKFLYPNQFTTKTLSLTAKQATTLTNILVEAIGNCPYTQEKIVRFMMMQYYEST